MILESSHERIFSTDSGVIQNPMGLYIIRGDNMSVKLHNFDLFVDFNRFHCFSAVIGELDEDADAQRDLDSIRAAPLAPIAHS